MKKYFWWSDMKNEIVRYGSRCSICQQMKVELQMMVGLLQPLAIQEWRWKHILMDFVIGLPQSAKDNNTIWVIMDRLTWLWIDWPSRHTLLFHSGLDSQPGVLARKFMEVVWLDEVPVRTISKWDTRFRSYHWKTLMEHKWTYLQFIIHRLPNPWPYMASE